MQKWHDSVLRNTSYSISEEINSREKHTQAHFQKCKWKYFGGYFAMEELAVLHVLG